MITLRDYQEECSDAIMAALAIHPSTMVAMATGLGKTVVFAEIIKRFQPKRALVIAQQDQIIYQAHEKILTWAGIHSEIEMADLVASTNLFSRAQCVLATVQTLNSGKKDKKRMLRFKPSDFGLIVIDEFHHACAKSYRAVMDYFVGGNPDIKILGVTATPKRGDGVALGQICKSVAFEYPIVKAVENGWLVDVAQHFCPVGSLDYSHVRKSAGELNGSDLAAVMEAEENVQGICHPTLEVMYGLEPHTLDKIPVPEWSAYLASLNRTPRRTILFTVSVAQAEASCNIFNRVVPHLADWVCGKTSKDKRADTFKRFAVGETHLLANVGVTTEGYDNAFVEVIAMGAPTLSLTKYLQMAGRGTRTLPGVLEGKLTVEDRLRAIRDSAKPRVRIVDFKGNSHRFKLITSFDALGGNMSPSAIERAIANCLKDGKPKSVLKAIDNAKEALKVEAAARARRAEEGRKAGLVAKSNFSWHDVDPFGGQTERLPMPARSKDGRMFSGSQMKRLREAGVSPHNIGYRQGQAIIGKLLSRASKGQAEVLDRAGYSRAEIKAFDRKSASAEIDKLEANGWRRTSIPEKAVA
jgi:superfamily II DNA or RNA helicase